MAPSRSGQAGHRDGVGPLDGLARGRPRPRPPPSAAAQSATAVPCSTSWPSAITPPAPHPASTPGASASCTPSSIASGALEVRAARRTRTRRRRSRPPRPARALGARLDRGEAGIGLRREPGGDAHAHPPATILRAVHRSRALARAGGLRPHRGRQDGGRAGPRRPPARGGRRARGGVRRRAAGLPRPGDAHRRRVAASERAALEHRLVSCLAVDRALQRRALRPARARRDRRACSPTAPRRSSSAARACTCAPPWPTSTCVRPRRRSCASAGRRSLRRPVRAALHERLAARAPWAAREIAPTDASRLVRAHELLDLGALHPPEGPNRLWTADTRHPTHLAALTMDRDELNARIDARVEAMASAGAAEEVRAADAAGASPTARKALGFEELLRGDVAAMQRRTRQLAKRQLTWLRKLPGVQLVDVTGRDPGDVAARAPPWPAMARRPRIEAMSKVFEDGIDERMAAWIARQRLFFVATAPSDGRPRQRLAQGPDRDPARPRPRPRRLPRPDRQRRRDRRPPARRRAHHDHALRVRGPAADRPPARPRDLRRRRRPGLRASGWRRPGLEALDLPGGQPRDRRRRRRAGLGLLRLRRPAHGLRGPARADGALGATKLRKEGPDALRRYVEERNATSIDGLPAFDVARR